MITKRVNPREIRKSATGFPVLQTYLKTCMKIEHGDRYEIMTILRDVYRPGWRGAKAASVVLVFSLIL
jgi:hypothetical protein